MVGWPVVVQQVHTFICAGTPQSACLQERTGVENDQLTLHLQWSRLQLNPSELAELSDLTYAANAVSFEVGPDRWMWSPESSGLFTVRNIRKIIEEKSFPNDGFGFFWNRWVPLKINLSVWRLVLDRLPTTTNLSRTMFFDVTCSYGRIKKYKE